MIKFCQNCSNLSTLELIDNNLVYRCTACQNIDRNVDKCLLVNELKTNSQDYQITPNIIHDYTVPRTRSLECPHCQKNTEIIIYQINRTSLACGYLCSECLSTWKA